MNYSIDLLNFNIIIKIKKNIKVFNINIIIFIILNQMNVCSNKWSE